MNCIIIADRPSKGIKSKGWNGLIKINKRETLIQNQIKVIRQNFPKSKIIYIYGFDYKKVEEYFHYSDVNNLVYVNNNQFASNGESYSVSMVSEFLEQDCLIFFGNLILKPSMFKNFHPKKSQLFITPKIENELGCTFNDSGFVEHICYGLENYLGNVYYISKNDIEQFKNLITKNHHRNYFLFEIINKMIENGSKFKTKTFDKKNIFESITDKNRSTICK
jgi:choline kinase